MGVPTLLFWHTWICAFTATAATSSKAIEAFMVPVELQSTTAVVLRCLRKVDLQHRYDLFPGIASARLEYTLGTEMVRYYEMSDPQRGAERFHNCRVTVTVDTRVM